MIDENETFANLVDLDQEDFNHRYEEVIKTMKSEGKWFRLDNQYKGNFSSIKYNQVSFHEIGGKKHLAIGRSTYYDQFMINKKREYGHEIFQSDYLVWINPRDPLESLKFYLDTAENIDVNLQGLSYQDILLAVNFGKAAISLKELKTRYMTIWELNQILFSDNKAKAKWNYYKDQDKSEIVRIFGDLIEIDNIIAYID